MKKYYKLEHINNNKFKKVKKIIIIKLLTINLKNLKDGSK